MAIHIALAKGRIHKVVMKYLAESGYDFPTYSEESRKLIFEDAKGQLKVTLVKSPDVAVYVERGLEVLKYFMDFSARMICNPVSFKMKYDEIQQLMEVIREHSMKA